MKKEIKMLVGIIIFNCVSRPKIYSARSLVNLRNIYKFTQETFTRKSSFDR